MIWCAVAAVATRATSATGRIRRNRLTPHACSATNSRSADRRPKPIRIPSSTDIGIVRLSACGRSVTRAWRNVDHATPLAISGSAYRRIGGMIERRTSAAPGTARTAGAVRGSRSDRRFETYGLEGRPARPADETTTDDQGRDPLAHAPAVLRGPRHRRAHPAVGAAARAQGLLRHGRRSCGSSPTCG